MTWTNYDDVLAQLRACRLVVDRLDVDHHKITRCKVEGDHEKRGWYRLFSLGDLIAGAFGIWSANDPQSFKVELPKTERKALTADQIAAIKAKQETEKKRAEAERAREIERAAQQASVWWRKLQDAGQSGYMAKKGFDATELFGARVSPSGNLVVPVQDTTGKTFGLQVIMAKKNRHGRDKDFTPPGLAKKGHFFQMGVVQRGGTVLLCEGYATGASLRKATGLPVVVAFDAGNLTSVAIEIDKAHRKDVRILVCADDDYNTMLRTGKNPGRDAAQTAAKAAATGAVVWPRFPGGERGSGVIAGPVSTEKRAVSGEFSAADHDEIALAASQAWDAPAPTRNDLTDFNDLHCHPDGGLQAVRSQVEEAIARAGWAATTRMRHARAALPNQGGGEHTKVSVPSGQRAQAVMYLDDIVERFIPLDDGTGDYVWDTWTRKIVKHKQMITLLKAGVRGDDIKRHPVWEERGAYYLYEVGFDPTEADPAVKLNTWQGWPLEPKAGKCEIIRQLLQYLCIEDHIYRWLLCWMAWPLQHPGAKLGSAVIMHGPQGTGKSVVFNVILATIYGRYATVLNQRGIEDRFNSDYTDSKLYVCTEEAFASEKWHVRHELKELVTGATVRINPKNVAAYSQKNQMNFVFLSNEGQPLPLENDDRRHLVVYTPPKLMPDFYDEVFAEIDNGGTEAFYHYLLNLDIERTYPGWRPKKHPPMTEAKQALIDLSAPSESRFVKDWLHGDADLPICPALATDAYDAYMRWCRRNGEARPRPSNHFIGYLDRLGGWTKKKVQTYSNSDYHGEPKVQSVIFPPKAALQAAGYDQPDGHTQLRWVTDSTCRFHDSVHGEEKWRATG